MDPPKKSRVPADTGLATTLNVAARRGDFHGRLKWMQIEASKTPEDEKLAHQVVGNYCGYDDAVLAIASVWEGLKAEGINYAFGSTDFFRLARQGVRWNSTCAGTPHPLIIPLEFSKTTKDPPPVEWKNVKPVPPKTSLAQMEKEEKAIAEAQTLVMKEIPEAVEGGEAQTFSDGGPKQFALAIAERDPSSATGIFVTYMNSGSTPSQDIVRAAVRNTVLNSAWMPDGAWPLLSREVWQTVAQQANNAAGGTHLVLNAWAYMLNLRLNATWSISSEEQNNFYKEARTVINLALRGHMNGDTILSFLVAYRYAPAQGGRKSQQHPRNLQSVLMNHHALADVIRRMKKDDNGGTRTTGTGPSTTAGAVVKTAPWIMKPTPPGVPTGPIVKPPPAINIFTGPTTNPAPPSTSSTRPLRTPRNGIVIKAKTEWTDTLQQRLNACEYKRMKLGKVKLHSVKMEQLTDEDVILAIAAVWRGLWNDDLRFAFGTANLFQLCREPPGAGWHGNVAVGAPNDFIIPLLFNDDATKKKTGPIGARSSTTGHFLLAIAARDSDDSKDVNIRILDSAKGVKNLKHTRTTAQKIVRYSGWMGLTPKGTVADVQPRFTEEIITTPQQIGGVECGFYVIFNAWAFMLGIPVINSTQRNGTTSDADFLQCGRRVVNLALCGCLDAGTVQAFFNHFGYCEAQDPADAVQPMDSVRMDERILEKIMQELAEVEQAIAAMKGPAQGPTQGPT